jgi:beta-barrel assembly-enhancing protease
MRLAADGKHSQALLRAVLLPVAVLLASCAAHAPPVNPAPIPVPPEPAIIAPLIISPVSSPEQEILRSRIALQDRLYRVAAPLLVNNTELCKGAARSLLGFTAKNKYSYSDEFIDAAQHALGLDDRLQVSGVLAGSGAAQVGIRRGDSLVTVADKPMPQGPNAERQAATLLAPLVNGHTSVKLMISRAGSDITLNVPLTPACAFGIELGLADNVNAYADGARVMITRGMLNFAASDDELAYVLAKEMAHNALRHPRRQKMNATIGGIIDNLIRMHPDLSAMAGTAGVKAMPPELDAAADRLALYMVARADYRFENALPFWQRLATKYPATVLNSYTAIHPAIAARFSAIEKAISEIKAKQAAKKPLVP